MSNNQTNTSREGVTAKGEIARAKIKASALSVMAELGYHKMRIADVTAHAGVAAGLFYHYFKDLKSLTQEVLEDFVSHSLEAQDIERDVDDGDWYGLIVAHNSVVVKAYAERPGIMRCLLQLADEEPLFAAILRKNFVRQLNWLTRHMPELFPAADMSAHQALMVVYTLAGTGETVLRDYYVNRERVLVKKKLSQHEMTELISVMFYRGLFLENPPAKQLRYAANLVAMAK